MRFESNASLLAFCLLICQTISVCQQGIEYYWGGNYQRIFSTAWASSNDFSGSHTAEFRGSFVSRITGYHKFELWSDTYGTSIFWTPSTKFIFDWEDRGTHKELWQWNTDLVKDFRYQMRLTVQDYYRWIRISIAVDFSGHSKADLDGDLISTCEESGCRETELSQIPFNCQPSPSMTLSHSPSPTRSHTPTSTESHTPSPTHSHTPSPTESQTPTSTESQTPSPTHSQTPSPTRSHSPVASPSFIFHLSDAFPESFNILQSHTFDESHRPNQSLTFCISSTFSESVFVNDSFPLFNSHEFNPSIMLTTDSDVDSIGNSQVVLIVSVVSSLIIVIGLIVTFLLLKKRRHSTKSSSDVLFTEFVLEEDSNISGVKEIDEMFDDTLPDGLYTVAQQSDDCP
jgi:hypothetical protein